MCVCVYTHTSVLAYKIIYWPADFNVLQIIDIRNIYGFITGQLKNVTL